ncbi:pyrroline-5-carboxylate reductase [Shewanella algae]|uniref:pyrroline-5-carboxylate reductase n=1 Tax=Shewanella algae TaxID=38313 RepID=UPI000F42478C|nr:pyrroline-5-carboxylate reductase [Shewanella algae]AYV13012.1 pyrroline-5-carboxylate reductase [Shewanella algae]MBO2678488.1 pyrroline-5-carboxylate reductase [Shewanella algae]
MAQKKICFIGAGNMSRSIISGLVGSGYPAELIQASNPSTAKLDALKRDFGILTTTDNQAACDWADIIVLSVKPQLMQQVCEQLATLPLADKLFITIAAGIPATRYNDYFGQQIKLIRTMPNTPTQLGYGMTGLYGANGVEQADKDLCQQIMASGGETLWVDKEADLNLVIALAGSSPAYFFLFMEGMMDAAKELGLDESKARLLVQQAALGASQMVIQNPQLSAGQLRQNVTSKGGTTHEAVETFQRSDLKGLIKQAMNNCIARAEAMAKEF